MMIITISIHKTSLTFMCFICFLFLYLFNNLFYLIVIRLSNLMVLQTTYWKLYNYNFLITWITNIVTNNKLHIIGNNFFFSDEVCDYNSYFFFDKTLLCGFQWDTNQFKYLMFEDHMHHLTIFKGGISFWISIFSHPVII
jgi:hypothetical protein